MRLWPPSFWPQLSTARRQVQTSRASSSGWRQCRVRCWPHDLAGLGGGKLGSPLSRMCASKNQTSRAWKAQEQGVEIHPRTHPGDTAAQRLVRHEPAGVAGSLQKGQLRQCRVGWGKGSAEEVKDPGRTSDRGCVSVPGPEGVGQVRFLKLPGPGAVGGAARQPAGAHSPAPQCPPALFLPPPPAGLSQWPNPAAARGLGTLHVPQSVCLGFLICEMGTIIPPISKGALMIR